MNIPNFLSVFRIFLVPFLVWLIIAGELRLAFITFVIAGITDGVDGYLAKKYGWETELGAYLDPIADKMLLVSVYAALGSFSYLPVWLVIAVISRDILIISAIMLSWMLERPVRMKPLFISKANTVGQIVLAAGVLGGLGFGMSLDGLLPVAVWTVGILTVLSAVFYLRTWIQHMTEPSYSREVEDASAFNGKDAVEKRKHHLAERPGRL